MCVWLKMTKNGGWFGVETTQKRRQGVLIERLRNQLERKAGEVRVLAKYVDGECSMKLEECAQMLDEAHRRLGKTSCEGE